MITKTPSRLALCLALALSAPIACLAQAQERGPVPKAAPAERFAPGRILLKPKAGVAEAALADLLNGFGAKSSEAIGPDGMRMVSVPVGREREISGALAKSPLVEFAELDRMMSPAGMSLL